MKIVHIACLNIDPEIQPNMGPKCNPVGGEPRTHVFMCLVLCSHLTTVFDFKSIPKYEASCIILEPIQSSAFFMNIFRVA